MIPIELPHSPHTLVDEEKIGTSWRNITFLLEPNIAKEIARAWSWLVPEPWEPIICSIVGGIFLETPNGDVLWLDTATGSVETVAQSRSHFEEIMRLSEEKIQEWFLPPLVERLHCAGKKPKENECYGFITSPVFSEGRYDINNMFVLSVREQLLGAANFHRQLHGLADDTKIKVTFKHPD